MYLYEKLFSHRLEFSILQSIQHSLSMILLDRSLLSLYLYSLQVREKLFILDRPLKNVKNSNDVSTAWRKIQSSL